MEGRDIKRCVCGSPGVLCHDSNVNGMKVVCSGDPPCENKPGLLATPVIAKAVEWWNDWVDEERERPDSPFDVVPPDQALDIWEQTAQGELAKVATDTGALVKSAPTALALSVLRLCRILQREDPQ